ncbi:MAG: hypothetical protein ABIQ77_01675 [Anaerolineales bacterium]
MSFWDWRKILKIWGPPLAGIAGMVLLGRLFEVAHFFLFAHHLFWIFAVILLINPVSETFWPSDTKTRMKGRKLPQPSAKARVRRETLKHSDTQKPASASETPTGRLAQLHKQKEAVDQKIEKLTDKHHANRN